MAEKVARLLCCALIVVCLIDRANGVDISGIACNQTTVGQANCQNYNAVCANTDTKCSCKSGYEKNNDSGCLKILGKACTATADCSNDAKAECTDSTCQCKTGYIGKNDVCTKVLDMACTDNSTCSSVTNSACTALKCACATNFVKEGVVCKSVKSSAQTAILSVGFLLASLLVVFQNIL